MFSLLNTSFKIRVGFLLSIFLLVVTSVVSFIICTSFLRKVSLVNHSQLIISHIQELQLNIKETESNVRAYAINSDSVYLIPNLNEQHQKVNARLNLLNEDITREDSTDINVKILTLRLNERFSFWEKIIKDPSCLKQKYCIAEDARQMNELAMVFSTIIYKQKKILADRNLKYIENAGILIPIILITSFIGVLISFFSYLGLQNEIQKRQVNVNKLTNLRAELESKIVHLNRSNDELDKFAYVASHDLQEPLRKIISFSEVLVNEQSNAISYDAKVYLGIISSASLRMRKLIEELLNYSRLAQNSTSQFSYVDMNLVLEGVIKDLDVTIKEKKAEISVDELPPIWGIKFQLNQLFINLLSNSLKYSSPERIPLVRIKNHVLSGERIRDFIAQPTISYCKIEITDNGIGFEHQFEQDIFMIFNRLHGRSEYEGTGIGLAICKRVVENHQGFIKAEGHINEGATFTIFLPVDQYN